MRLVFSKQSKGSSVGLRPGKRHKMLEWTFVVYVVYHIKISFFSAVALRSVMLVGWSFILWSKLKAC